MDKEAINILKQIVEELKEIGAALRVIGTKT